MMTLLVKALANRCSSLLVDLFAAEAAASLTSETVSETGRVVRTFGRFNARSGARLSFPDCDEDGGVRVGRHSKCLRSTRAVARWYARAMGIEQGT